MGLPLGLMLMHADSSRVLLIMESVTPFQVFYSVIRLDAVDVVELRQVIGVGYVGSRNQLMHPAL